MKFHVESWQCKQVLLACCYDAGYVPFLGQFAADKKLSSRITILQGDPPSSKIAADFKKLHISNVFAAKQSLMAIPTAPSQLQVAPLNVYHSGKSQRFGPILRNAEGKRVDRSLSVDQDLVNRLEKFGLCYYLFLRGECRDNMCKRNHQRRPLDDREWNALWLLARKGRCFKARRDIFCDDAMCVYSHS